MDGAAAAAAGGGSGEQAANGSKSEGQQFDPSPNLAPSAPFLSSARPRLHPRPPPSRRTSARPPLPAPIAHLRHRLLRVAGTLYPATSNRRLRTISGRHRKPHRKREGHIYISGRYGDHALKTGFRPLSGRVDDLRWSPNGLIIVVFGDGKGKSFIHASATSAVAGAMDAATAFSSGLRVCRRPWTPSAPPSVDASRRPLLAETRSDLCDYNG